MKIQDNQHIISIILLVLTLISIKFFYESLFNNYIGKALFIIFFIAGLLYISLSNLIIFLAWHNISDIKIKFVQKIRNWQYFTFIIISIVFWWIFVVILANSDFINTHINFIYLKDQIHQQVYNNIFGVILAVVYPGVILGMAFKVWNLEKRIREFSIRVSPRERISITGNVESTEMLIIYFYNDSNKKLENIKLKVYFPKEIHYWIGSTFNELQSGNLLQEVNVEPKGFTEVRIIPVYIGKAIRTGGMIRIYVESMFGSFDKCIYADMSDPSKSREEVLKNI